MPTPPLPRNRRKRVKNHLKAWRKGLEKQYRASQRKWLDELDSATTREQKDRAIDNLHRVNAEFNAACSARGIREAEKRFLDKAKQDELVYAADRDRARKRRDQSKLRRQEREKEQELRSVLPVGLVKGRRVEGGQKVSGGLPGTRRH